MGLFDNVTKNVENVMDKAKEYDKKYEENLKKRENKRKLKEKEKEVEKKRKQEEKKNIVLEKWKKKTAPKAEKKREKIQLGVMCAVPKNTMAQKGHSGVTKGVATLGLGLVGWAATSGSKAERQKMLIPAKIKVLPEGVVIEAELENPIRIPFNKIVKTSQTLNTIIIHLINGQNIYIERCRDYNEVNYLINEGACGEEKDLWNELEDENINNQNIISSVEELEKVMNMYEKGLITDEEFSIMKKKIIEK